MAARASTFTACLAPIMAPVEVFCTFRVGPKKEAFLKDTEAAMGQRTGTDITALGADMTFAVAMMEV